MPELMSLRLRAEAGDARAQVVMAHASLVGKEAPYAPDYALRLLQQACEKNFADALLLRGVLSMMGLHTPRNYDEAFGYLARAAATGDPRARGQLAALSGEKGKIDLDPWRARPEATQHFAEPRLFTFKNFIPKAACDWMIARGRKRKMEKAATWDHGTGGERIDSTRSNSQTSIGMLDADLVTQLIHLRIAGATGTPLLNQEPTSLLRYEVGQEYKPHFDFITAKTEDLKLMGQRVGTFLIYLNSGYEGGETAFPRLQWRFKGEPGDALFFWNLSARGEPEQRSLHAGLPVLKGEKWLWSKWIRADQAPFWWPPLPPKERPRA